MKISSCCCSSLTGHRNTCLAPADWVCRQLLTLPVIFFCSGQPMDGNMRQDTSHASRTALQNALKRIDYLRTSISTPDSGYNLLVLRSCALTESGARRAAVTPWL